MSSNRRTSKESFWPIRTRPENFRIIFLLNLKECNSFFSPISLSISYLCVTKAPLVWPYRKYTPLANYHGREDSITEGKISPSQTTKLKTFFRKKAIISFYLLGLLIHKMKNGPLEVQIFLFFLRVGLNILTWFLNVFWPRVSI